MKSHFLRSAGYVTATLSLVWLVACAEVERSSPGPAQQEAAAARAADSVSPLHRTASALACDDGTGIACSAGLHAAYYDNSDFTDLVVFRVDPTVDFDWASGSPAPELGTDNFSAQWSGYLTPDAAGSYVFSAWSDDGVELFLDGQLIVSDLIVGVSHASRYVHGAPIALEARPYRLYARAVEYGGQATARLLMRDANTPTVDASLQPIPTPWLSQNGEGAGLRREIHESVDTMRAGVSPLSVSTVNSLAFDFSDSLAGASDGFANRVTGRFFVPYPGEYTFRLLCDAAATLAIDGSTSASIDRAGASAPIDDTVTLTLRMGSVAGLRLEAYDAEWNPSSECEVRWSHPLASGTPDGDGFYALPDSRFEPAMLGRGTGLEGQYFDNDDFTNRLVVQTDPVIDFDWGTGAPNLSDGSFMGADGFSVRWQGAVQAVTTEAVTFHVEADDTLAMWMASEYASRAGSDSCGTDTDCGWDSECRTEVCFDPLYVQHIVAGGSQSVTLPMEAGARYPIRLDFEEGVGNSSAVLEWQSSSIMRETVPVSQLYPPGQSIADGQGLEAHYFDYNSSSPPSLEFNRTESNAEFIRTDDQIDFNWGLASPSPATGFPSDDFMVRWMGQMRARYSETYTLRLFHDNGARVWVDGELVIDRWDSGTVETVASVALVAGKRHDLVVQMREGRGGARARLLWSSSSQLEEIVPQSRLFLPPLPGAGTGLLGEYYGGSEVSSSALRLVRIDPVIQFDYEDGPAPVVSIPGHLVTWSGEFEPIYNETYTITVRSNGGARLFINDELVAETWEDAGDALQDVHAELEAQNEQMYAIRVEYSQAQLHGQVELLWSSPSQVESVIPTGQLYPASPEDRIAFGQCESVLQVDLFDDGTGLPEGLTDDGGLQLTSSTVARPDMWIANTLDRTVTRLDTSTGQVVATYPAGIQASRTAVDLDHNAWVANRALGSGQVGTLSKLISVHGDGTDCVCCDVEVEGGECSDYDPLSICDECVAYTVELGANTIPRGLAVDANNDVWVGLYRTHELVHIRNCDVDPDSTRGDWTVDPECATPRCGPGDTLCIARATELGNDCSGALPNDECRGDLIIARYDLPRGVNPYGMAIDTNGYLWIADPNHIGCFDTETAEFCGLYRTDWSLAHQAAEQTGCDRPYGIAVDDGGNIWWGEWSCGGLGYLDRETWENARDANTDPDGTTWSAVEQEVSLTGTQRYQHPQDYRTRGVAVDGNGIVWLAASGTNRMLRFDPSLPPPQWRESEHAECVEQCTVNRLRPDGSSIGAAADLSECTIYCGPLFGGDFTGSYPTCSNPIGVGISNDGDAWGVCYTSRRAQAFRDDGSIRFEVDTGSGPYSYSDMTGFQLRNFTAPQGQWRRVFDCTVDGGRVDENGRCVFDYVSWNALTPIGSRVVVEVRVGDDGDGGEVEWGSWSAENEVTPAPLSGNGYGGRYVEVRVTLFASPRGQTPVVYDINLWQCPRLAPPIDFAVDDLTIISQGATPNYTISWAFTDDSWPEVYFEVVDEQGNVRCTVLSESSSTLGQRYSGNDPLPACLESGHTSNTPQTRRPRAVSLYGGETLRSYFDEQVTAYTLVNDPQATYDMRFMDRTSASITVNWCNPRQNWSAGLTGARLERSTTSAFVSTDLDYQVISDFPSDPAASLAERGYASATAVCGNVVDEGLSPGTTYFYRLTFQNGDGVDSVPLVMSHQTAGAACCEDIGNCEGVCGEATENAELECTLPPTFEADETVCDDLDNDCDGLVDEGVRNACDTCGAVPPEVCDGADNDCDGVVDDNPIDGFIYFADTDLDGFGDPNSTVTACVRPTGYVSDDTDCDDTNNRVYPNAEEICDGLDNDCDGDVDEGLGQDHFPDIDLDGFGDSANAYSGCMPPGGYIEVGGDCDDTRGDVNPDETEVCDDVDNDCDGQVDENFMELGVTIDEQQTVADIGVEVCHNEYFGAECASTIAITLTVTNLGDVAVGDDAQFALTLDSPGGDTLIESEDLGVALDVGAEVTLTYCYTNSFEVLAADRRALIATVAPPGGLSCGARSDSIDDFEMLLQPEVCDGIDNDCNEGIDELPEACGSPLYICVENSGTTGDPYLCVITLETESSVDDEGCELLGTCGESCQADEDCGASAECHRGQCVALVDIEAAREDRPPSLPSADAATSVERDDSPEEGGQESAIADPSGERGCSSSLAPMSGAGWASCLVLLACLRRRRCGVAA